MARGWDEKEKRVGGCLGKTILVLGIVVLVVVGISALRAGGEPEVEIAPGVSAIGPKTPLTVKVAEPRRGLSRVKVELIQGERVAEIGERTYQPRSAFSFFGKRTAADELALELSGDAVGGLATGDATVRVTADRAGTWLRSPDPVVVEKTLPVRLTPPSLAVLSSFHYAAQGGSEAVVYRVGETAVEDGVAAGDYFFPGFPLPGGAKGERFALFAVPYDVADSSRVRLTATDEVGNVAEAAFIDRFTPRPYKEGEIRLTEEFMARVVPEIMSQTPGLTDRGNLLENYVQINSDLREKNRLRLLELAEGSKPEFLWREAFLQMPNAQVMSPFAVRRSYLFEDKQVDEEFHLGFDLATIERDKIPASNDGVVVVAEYFGIYGNSVILDHGYGLMSLYGHLSSIDVAKGDRVTRGQSVGRTGQTGLAGGDHLHFGILLQGLPVTPVEWWDGHWIQDRIKRKLGDAMPFGGKEEQKEEQKKEAPRAN